jgi:hypothetical protein
MSEGAHIDEGGQCPILFKKWVLYYTIWDFIVIMPDIVGFSPFLGDIGHFLSSNFGRKLEMSNQLQIYINQACLRPWRTVKRYS